MYCSTHNEDYGSREKKKKKKKKPNEQAQIFVLVEFTKNTIQNISDGAKCHA